MSPAALSPAAAPAQTRPRVSQHETAGSVVLPPEVPLEVCPWAYVVGRPTLVCSRSPASCGLVANMTSSGTPASSRRSSSAAQSAGRYRARPDQGMTARGHVREGDRDLACRDSAGHRSRRHS
jgi:hypothetical protein